MSGPIVKLELTVDDARALAVAAHLCADVEPLLRVVAPYIDIAVGLTVRDARAAS